jgi:hypothetical protein
MTKGISMTQDQFPHSGKTFLVTYPTMKATNAYSADGLSLRYEILSGAYRGTTALVNFKWTKVGDDSFLISWQEADRATVVHFDNFRDGQSETFFTAATLEFIRLQGTIEEFFW